jgi:hypothetical protein
MASYRKTQPHFCGKKSAMILDGHTGEEKMRFANDIQGLSPDKSS